MPELHELYDSWELSTLKLQYIGMQAISGRGLPTMAPLSYCRLIRMDNENPTFCVARDGNAQIDKEDRQYLQLLC